ncbi:MAG: HAD family hydrolase [Ruminiclostridium sp.]
MKTTTILFDLDGTLLPMDNDEFTKGYFKLLVKKLAPYGYEPQKLIDGVWAGTGAMVKNNGGQTNEQAFWAKFAEVLGDKVYADKPLFDEFYRTDFQNAKAFCGYNPKAPAAVHTLKEKGFSVVLATNPIFPSIATESRIKWAGLEPEDFLIYTTYENIGYCKPNPEYYREIARRLGVSAEQCLMVGNDAAEDMEAAKKAGMRVFLLTDCLINKENRDISLYPNGGFEQLMDFVMEECGINPLFP